MSWVMYRDMYHIVAQCIITPLMIIVVMGKWERLDIEYRTNDLDAKQMTCVPHLQIGCGTNK